MEYVKIDPMHIGLCFFLDFGSSLSLKGVGMYQQDVNPKKLARAAAEVMEDCVNDVGVDLNV
jgi:transcriptional accessory protein Tex/SPT6